LSTDRFVSSTSTASRFAFGWVATDPVTSLFGAEVGVAGAGIAAAALLAFRGASAGAEGAGAIKVCCSTAVGEVSSGFETGAASDFCLGSPAGLLPAPAQ